MTINNAKEPQMGAIWAYYDTKQAENEKNYKSDKPFVYSYTLCFKVLRSIWIYKFKYELEDNGDIIIAKRKVCKYLAEKIPLHLI